MNEFWVDLRNLGLGFAEKGKRRRREEGENERNEWNGSFSFLYTRWVGSTQDPAHVPLILSVDQDPDGSGSIQRSWSVSLIRIHQIRGFGPFTRQFWTFFQFLDFFLLFTPLSLLFEPIRMLISLQKSWKNYHMFLDEFSAVLWSFHILKWIKSMRANFCLIYVFLILFCEFSCAIMDPIFVLWNWYLICNVCDVFISEFMLFLHSCIFNC